MDEIEKIKEWDYMGNRYRWTEKARHQGMMDCACKSCQRAFKRMVKDGELIKISKA